MGFPPCRAALPDLARLRNAYRSKGLEILTVCLSYEKDTADFIAQKHLQIPVVVGATCEPEVGTAYKVTAYSTLYLLDSKGIVRARYVGTDMPQIKRDLAGLGL